MLLITDTFSCPLSALIQKEYNKLIEIVEQIPSTDRVLEVIAFTNGMVSVRDILAYQIGWGNLLLEWYNAGIKNEMIIMPGEGFTSWNYTGLAQLFYTKYRCANLQEQEILFCNTVRTILLVAEHEHVTGNLDKLGVWSWCTLASGKKWPLSKWIKINTASPYKRACLALKGLV